MPLTLGQKAALKRIAAWIAGSLTSLVLLLCILFIVANTYFPFNSEQQLDHAVTVYSRDGEVLRQFANSKGTFRIPVRHQIHQGRVIRPVSSTYLTALLAYEDQYFYQHPGVNPFSLIRALGQQLWYGKVISGGSTITMQVARMLYPYHRSYAGKVSQIFRALQLELRYNKEEILDLYLTYTPMGGNIEGVEAGAQRYFAKPAKHLNINEAITLVVLPQRPSATRPDRYPERAKAARDKVLMRVQQQLQLSDEALEMLKQSPLNAGRYVRQPTAPLLARRLKTQRLTTPSLTAASSTQSEVHTYIDPTLQSSIDKLIAQRMTDWPQALSNAILVMDNQNGEVIAYKGSADFTDLRRYGHVDMVHAIRSPGSTLKPFIYGLAMDTQLVDSGSLLMDVPISHGHYEPQNFNHHFSGPIRLDKALQLSKNAPVVQVLSHLGSERFIDWLTDSPITLVANDPDLTVALGGVGTNLESLVTLYSTLARAGVSIRPRYSPDHMVQTTPLLSRDASWILFDILSHIPPPERFSAAYRRKIAWKTGTSYGFRDAWAVGTSQRYTVGVWVGRPDGAPNVGQTGARQAAPILFDLFDLLPPESGSIAQPNSVQRATTCWPSGLLRSQLTAEHCTSMQPAWLIEHQAPPTLRFQESFQALHQWPVPLKQWALSKGISLEQSPQSARDKVTIVRPRADSQFFPYPGQKLNLRANQSNVQWFLNDYPLEDKRLQFDELKQGTYTLTACKLLCDSVRFTVYK